MQKKKEYNIALDIGTASVGWSVTDKENNLYRKGGRNMWGVRTFREAETAETRRIFRSTRRRLNRRKERINILQSLLIEDIEKVDENFIPRLKETNLIPEDKTIAETINGKKYNLFSGDYTDEDYFYDYPTIYHLRDALINDKKQFDIRLVYFAIHHIIKYRGNFLYEGNLNVTDNDVIKERIAILIEFLEERQIFFKEDSNLDTLINILKDNNTAKRLKKDKLIEIFNFDAEGKRVITQLVNAILGYKFSLNTLFETDIEKGDIYLSREIENEEEILSILEAENQADVYESLKDLYSWQALQGILKGENSISKAFVNKYKKYGEDLKKLKKIYRDNFTISEYNKMFKDYIKKSHNYYAYDGSGKDACEPEKFFKKVESDLKELPDDLKEKAEIIEAIKNEDFLIKLKTYDNGSIPHQLHKLELEQILENQSKYYNSINENKDKIIQILTFRIPYYVGPLSMLKDEVKEDSKEKSHTSEWAWLVRKSNEKILPWNFDEIIDVNATAEEFIKRMTSFCTYLLEEKVIPKHSLLYSEYNVLQELTNLRLNGNKLSADAKMNIIEELFKKRKSVSTKALETYFKNNGFADPKVTSLSDSTKFNSTLTSYIDMTSIFGKIDEDNYKSIEEIIYWITLFEDKKVLRSKITEKYPDMPKEIVDKLVKLNYTGWSRLSEKLLNGIKSHKGRTIIEIMRESKENFQQIITSKKYGFKEIIADSMPKVDKIEYSNIDELQTSPANKRAIWQAIRIVKEIVKAMGTDPNNIYIEFARGEDESIKGKRIDSRLQKLKKIYENIESQVEYFKDYDPEVYIELKKQKDMNDRYFLYYLQNGKCIYTGDELDIKQVSYYDIDHIVPRSYIKDDSLDNRVLVKSKENRGKSNNRYVDLSIINERQNWWKALLTSGLMTQAKYYKLIEGKNPKNINEEQFIKRQLVETRQIIKHVTNLLKNLYSDTNIFAIRSRLVNDFREKYNVYKNRNVNNAHHAHDAYIASVIGNTINKHLHIKEEFIYNDYVKNFMKKDMKEKRSERERHGLVMYLLDKNVDIPNVLKKFNYKDHFFSEKLEENTGPFYKQTLYRVPDKDSQVKNPIPAKDNRDPFKYGGYSQENKAYLVLFKYIDGKVKTQYELIGIPVVVSYNIKSKKESLNRYLEKYLSSQKKEYTNLEVLKDKILINQEFKENDTIYKFSSDSEIRVSKPLYIEQKYSEIIFRINKNMNTNNTDFKEKNLIEDEEYLDIFDYLLTKLENEYEVFSSVHEKVSKHRETFKNLDDSDKNLTIVGLINIMSNGQGDLDKVGSRKRAGRMSGQNFKTKRLKEMTFISKSVTGIYERRFTLNELENRSGK